MDHFDEIVWHKSSAGTAAPVQGWRAYIFFNTGDIRSAFREINTLLSEEDKFDWVWPWCERLVGVHGRTSLDAAQKALRFWNKYLSKFPKNLKAKTEKLLVIWYVKSNGGSVANTILKVLKRILPTSFPEVPRILLFFGIVLAIGRKMKRTGSRQKNVTERHLSCRRQSMDIVWEPR